MLDIGWAHFYAGGMARRKDNLTPLGDVISELFQGGLLPFNPDDAKIWRAWDTTVGEAIAKHARPEWIKQKVLRVHVSDPIWLHELKYVGEEIRDRLNRNLGRCAVEKIEFRMDKCTS